MTRKKITLKSKCKLKMFANNLKTILMYKINDQERSYFYRLLSYKKPIMD